MTAHVFRRPFDYGALVRRPWVGTRKSVYQAAILADGPALYWRLGAGTDAVDLSGNGRHGTGNGSASFGGAVGTIFNDNDGALLLPDDSSSYVGSSYSPFSNASVRTFECWAYRNTTAWFDQLWTGSGTNYPRLEGNWTNTNFRLLANGSTVSAWTSAVSTGAWHHIVLIFDESNDQATLWVDGSSLGTNTYTTQWTTGGNFQVGGSDSAASWNGRVDEMAVYEFALSSTQIANHYSIGTTGEAAGTPMGLATETDTALAMGRSKVKATGLVSETDTAQPMTVAKTVALGLTTEADTALAMTRAKLVALGQLVETDSAFAMGRLKTRALGQAVETDSALVITPVKSSPPLGLATETDAALALAKLKQLAIGLATETETALSIAPAKSRALGLASEGDTALAMTHSKLKAIGLATETDAAQPIAVAKAKPIGLATQSEQAFSIVPAKAKQLGLAVELEEALPMTALGGGGGPTGEGGLALRHVGS